MDLYCTEIPRVTQKLCFTQLITTVDVSTVPSTPECANDRSLCQRERGQQVINKTKCAAEELRIPTCKTHVRRL